MHHNVSFEALTLRYLSPFFSYTTTISYFLKEYKNIYKTSLQLKNQQLDNLDLHNHEIQDFLLETKIHKSDVRSFRVLFLKNSENKKIKFRHVG